ncbi:hypothetical protein QOT17_007940 [Balamuthia mandrillaris]
MPNDNTIYMPVFLTQEAIYEDMTAVLETGHLILYSGFVYFLRPILLMFIFLRLPALASVIPVVNWSPYSKHAKWIQIEGSYPCNGLNIYNLFDITKKTTLILQKPKPPQHQLCP